MPEESTSAVVISAPQRMVNGVRDRRHEHGMTIADLVIRSGVSSATIVTIERNDGYAPAGSVMLRLAQALDARVQDLFWSEEAPA